MDRQVSAPPGYRTQSPDTSYEAEQVLFAAYRRMTPAERIRRACDLAEVGRRLAILNLQRRFPELTEHDIRLRLASWNIPEADLTAAFGWPSAEHRDHASGPHPRA